MRIGIVSDIHCNAGALGRALDLIGSVDQVICAGDLIYQFRFSNDVPALLRAAGARAILGNHEETFLGRDGERARAAAWIDAGQLAWVGALPQTIDTLIDGKRLVVVHGSPWQPHKEYLYPSSATLARFHDFDADFVILGHTHQAMALRFGRTLVVNPGSAGEARDPANGRRVSCAILDTAAASVQFCAFVDPEHPPAGREAEAPEWTTVTPEPRCAPLDASQP